MVVIFRRFFLYVALVPLVLAGCTNVGGFEPRPSDADRGGKTVYKPAKDPNALSPEEQHALAKALVDPTKSKQNNQYVKNAKDVERAQRAKEQQTRVARVEQDLDVVQKEFKGLRSAVRRAEIAPAAGSSGIKAHVEGVRLGEYPDKTRIVFDLDGPADFTFDVDNAQQLLVIRLPGARWSAAPERVFGGHKVLRAYAAKSAAAGGSVVAVKLHGPAKVLSSAKLGKNAAGKHRIFLDVAPL